MPAKPHVLATEIVLPLPREEVFAFFAAADNLERITPPELGFRITNPPFVNEQLKGPYALWHHTHTFKESEGNTIVSNRVRYQLLLWPLGRMRPAVGQTPAQTHLRLSLAGHWRTPPLESR